jgi:hypothetical protein
MFASIKDSLNKPQESNFKDILKFEAGKTYLVRLLPNVEAPAQTFFHYYHYSWKSFATGQFVSYVSPQTVGERCPIGEESYKIYKNGSPEEKERGKALYRKENYLVNVYVISDPTNPDNEGKVKIMRYGNQLQKIILSAIEGDDAEEFGPKIFDLSEKGCTFRIKCEKKSDKNAEFVEYTASRFLSPSKIDNLDEQKMEEIYKSIHDLSKLFTIKSYDDLKQALQEHYYGVSDGESAPAKKNTQKSAKKDEPKRVSTEEAPDEDDIPMGYKQTESKPETKTEVKTESKPTETKKPASGVEDDQIKNLLQGLDSL